MSLLFNSDVTLRVFTYTNNAGRKASTYADTDRIASVQPKSGNRSVDSGESQTVITHAVYFPAPEPDVKPDDRILWGTRTLSVLDRPIDQAGRGLYFRVDCREVR